MIHQLKCKPEYFEAIAAGDKTFEVRNNDRNFHAGDYLALNELTSHAVNSEGEHAETGRSVLLRVTYVLTDSEYCKDGMAILGFYPCRIFPSKDGCPVYTEKYPAEREGE